MECRRADLGHAERRVAEPGHDGGGNGRSRSARRGAGAVVSGFADRLSRAARARGHRPGRCQARGRGGRMARLVDHPDCGRDGRAGRSRNLPGATLLARTRAADAQPPAIRPVLRAGDLARVAARDHGRSCTSFGRSLVVLKAERALGLLAALIMLVATVTPSSPSSLSDGASAFRRGDYVIAFKKLRPLAEHGDAEAQAIVALMYQQGSGVPQDAVMAAHWYLSAAEQ